MDSSDDHITDRSFTEQLCEKLITIDYTEFNDYIYQSTGFKCINDYFNPISKSKSMMIHFSKIELRDHLIAFLEAKGYQEKTITEINESFGKDELLWAIEI